MARMKKPENETDEERKIRQIKENISNHASRSEKTSWERKRKNLQNYLVKLEPLQQQVLDIEANKIPILDKISKTRTEMVETCIHPQSDLIIYEDFAVCKFCNMRINVEMLWNES